MSDKYGVRHNTASREPFGPYRFDILRGGETVAEYLHDYRGDEHWLEIEGRHIECERLTTGGGPLPLSVTRAGAELLDSLLGSGK